MARRRIRRPKNQEETYKALTDKNEFGIFNSYKDIFMLAGIIGYLNNTRISFEESLEGIAWSVFNLDTDETVINAIALGDTQNPSILMGDDETFDQKIGIFEEYAAGGLQIVYDKIMEHKKFSAQNYFDFIMEMQNHKPDQEREIDQIADMLSF
ncbi:DNA phosphorothioation-associated protein 4 [Tuberibacillus sp. Marseille-P3662]|uniref:DNA phosphorothioation-associated protein 4 n=1 Tax=Tuberibacillus sp. Marseille-P3662 TaxID=1965358 RepID=UPI000A1CC888|nr:DNA phosphorothioation-associated protein 4 [Tuberibacillus sp. Marseille-P3662]